MEPKPLQFELPVNVSYTVLRQLMDKRLIGMELGSKSRKYAQIVGSQLEASPLPDYDVVLGLRIALHRKVVGFKELPIYLHGTLQYDASAELLSIGTFKMDSKSRNFLVDRALETLANTLYYQKIIGAAAVNIKESIRPQLALLNQRLSTGMSVVEGTRLSGRLEHLSVASVAALDNYIAVHVKVSGKFEVTLDELPPVGSLTTDL